MAHSTFRWSNLLPGLFSQSHINQNKTYRRNGATWNEFENVALLAEYYIEGANLPRIAERHKRGVNGITCQIDRLSTSEYRTNLTHYLEKFNMLTEITKPHPQAEVIHAYADGKDIQYRLHGATTHSWQDCNQGSCIVIGHHAYDWRIKPAEPVKTIMYASVPEIQVDGCNRRLVSSPDPRTSNVAITYVDGKLFSAEVIPF